MQLQLRVKEHGIAGERGKKRELKRKSLDVSDVERREARKWERGLKTWGLKGLRQYTHNLVSRRQEQRKGEIQRNEVINKCPELARPVSPSALETPRAHTEP